MISDLDILRKLVKDDALVFVQMNQYGKYYMELNEGKGETGYTIKLLNPPEDTIAIKADMLPALTGIFQNSKGECKRADFVIIAMDNKNYWLIYIELKRGKNDREWEIIQQLQGAACFIDYCRSIGLHFGRSQNFLNQKTINNVL